MSREALLLTAGFAAGLTLAEMGARVALPGPAPGRFFRLDEETGWSHRPLAEGWWVGSRPEEFRVFVRINSGGLRDREIPVARAAGSFRVLTLGDSITAGFQVPLEETFQKRTEALLRRAWPDREPEVINAGVNGYGTDNELLLWRARGRRYRPDLVCLVFYLGNDVADNDPDLRAPFSNYAKPRFVARDGRLDLLGFPYRPSALTRVSEDVQSRLSFSRLYQLARQARLEWQVTRQRPFRRERHERQARLWPEAWSLTAALVRQLRQEVEEEGAAFLVAVAPPPEAVEPDPGRASAAGESLGPGSDEARLWALLRADGIPWLSLTPALRARHEATGRPVYFRVDRHWNAEGHAVVAEVLVGAIEDRFGRRAHVR